MTFGILVFHDIIQHTRCNLQERRNVSSSKEYPKISKIAKFGCEMLQSTKNVTL
jgi:hypothetical protein